MTRWLAESRTWLPLAVAAAVLAARELHRPAATEPAPGGHAATLPMLRTGATPTRATHYELDRDRSSVRFLLRHDGGQSLFLCPLAAGDLTVGGDDADHRLELRLDLASLTPVDPQDHDGLDALRTLLGVHRGAEVLYRGGLVGRASTPVPGLHQLVWQGSLRFGGRTVRQAMQLWQTALPGRPLRLQGYGEVSTDTYGISRMAWLGMVPQQHEVTLGLDLAWQRVAGR